MSRKFRLDYIDKSDDEFDHAMLEYVGMVMDEHPYTDPNSRLIALYTPAKDDYWYYDKRWLSEVVEEHTKAEQVHSPKHYNVLEDIEAIQIIACSMSQEMFKGYCLGNILKYRLRCGAKDDVNQELAKADKYKELFAKYKHLCKEDK